MQGSWTINKSITRKGEENQRHACLVLFLEEISTHWWSWVLVNNVFTICTAEDDIISPTLDPEHSQPTPTACTEHMPEPTTGTESKPAAM